MPNKDRSRINLVKIATHLAQQRALWEPLVSYDPVARYYVRLAREPGVRGVAAHLAARSRHRMA